MRGNLGLAIRFSRGYVGPRTLKFAVVQLFHVAGAALLLVPPMLVRLVIDRAIPQGNFGLLTAAAGSVVGVFGLFFIVAALKEYWGHEVAQSITSRLRNDLYSHFQKLSMSFHDKKKTGSLLSRIVDDINVIEEVVHHGPEALILGLVLVAGSGGLLFYLNWRLALVALAVVPVLALFTSRLTGRMWAQFRDVRERKASLSDMLEENLSGIQIIKAFGAEDREVEAVARENANHYRSRMSVIRYVSLLFPGAIFLNSLGVGAVLVYGGYMAMGGALSVGTLTAFILYLNHFLHPILRLVMMMEHAGRFFASIERFYDYMDIEPDIRDRAQALVLPRRVASTEGPDATRDGVKGEVTFDNVHFRYEEKPVLSGVRFTAVPGQTVALVGPSGAGKTTITRLIPRFYEPQEGRVLVDGTDVRDIGLRSLRAHIGVVLQDDFLFSGSVAHNIRYSRPQATMEEVVQAARQANASPFIEQMPQGYDTEIGKRGVKLSEGQRQRISIARALLKNPEILLLDEATSSVDPETEKLIQKALEMLRRGRTTFTIAHRLSTIMGADRILFVQDGRILESGTHRELIGSDGEYARFFRIQFQQMLVGPSA